MSDSKMPTPQRQFRVALWVAISGLVPITLGIYSLVTGSLPWPVPVFLMLLPGAVAFVIGIIEVIRAHRRK